MSETFECERCDDTLVELPSKIGDPDNTKCDMICQSCQTVYGRSKGGLYRLSEHDALTATRASVCLLLDIKSQAIRDSKQAMRPSTPAAPMSSTIDPEKMRELSGSTYTIEMKAAGVLNRGHGHVFIQGGGLRARCGGPAMCRTCREDYESLLEFLKRKESKQPAKPAFKEGDIVCHKASGERAIVIEVLTTCIAHEAGSASCIVPNNDACNRVPVDKYMLSSSFVSHSFTCDGKYLKLATTE